MVTEQQINELALRHLGSKGRPEGKDVEHYFRAKQFLEERQASYVMKSTPSQTAQLSPLPPTPELGPAPFAEAPPGRDKRRRRTHRQKT